MHSTISTDISRGVSALLVAGALVVGSTTIGTAAPAVPVYPGATRTPVSSNIRMPDMCGSKVSVESYDSAMTAATVSGWYRTHVSGFVTVKSGVDHDSGTRDATTEMMANDGSTILVIQQLSYDDAKLQAAAKTIDADKTSIGVEHFQPALGGAYVAAVRDSQSGNAAVKAAARAKLGAKCHE